MRKLESEVSRLKAELGEAHVMNAKVIADLRAELGAEKQRTATAHEAVRQLHRLHGLVKRDRADLIGVVRTLVREDDQATGRAKLEPLPGMFAMSTVTFAVAK